MSVNGKRDEGDVYLEDDGYLRIYFKNTNDAWYEVLIQPEDKLYDLMWIGEARSKPTTVGGGKFVLNIKSLLKQVRKEMLDESSN